MGMVLCKQGGLAGQARGLPLHSPLVLCLAVRVGLVCCILVVGSCIRVSCCRLHQGLGLRFASLA
jgi:hypothetical protein